MTRGYGDGNGYGTCVIGALVARASRAQAKWAGLPVPADEHIALLMRASLTRSWSELTGGSGGTTSTVGDASAYDTAVNSFNGSGVGLLNGMGLTTKADAIGHPSIQALAAEDANLDRCQVEPTRVFGGVVKLHAVQELVGRLLT